MPGSEAWPHGSSHVGDEEKMIMCPVTRITGHRAVFLFFLETYNNEDNSLMGVTAVQTDFSTHHLKS